MPLLMPPDLPQSIMSSQYPAITKHASGMVDGVETEVSYFSFSDKIMITITQGGRLVQWVHVPLDTANPIYTDEHLPANAQDTLLPMAHLTPKILLGGSTSERETMGQLYASQIASAVILKHPEESRTLVIGLGFISKSEASTREAFFDTIDLVTKTL